MAKRRAPENPRGHDKDARVEAMAWLALADVIGFWGLRPPAPGAKAPRAQPE